MNSAFKNIEKKLLDGELIDFDEAIELSKDNIDNEDLFNLADKLCKMYTGNKIDLCTIMNVKSGTCSENCKYCAQSSHYNTGAEIYPLLDIKEILALAKENEKQGVHRFAIVTSGSKLTNDDFNKIIEIINVLKSETTLKLCASLGKISDEQAMLLKKAGISTYHHNIETCSEYYDKICDTHTFADRINTIINVLSVDLEICCGGIIGMGESMEQRIKMAFELRALGIKSIPINILNPIKGTPMENADKLDDIEILRTISLFRVIMPYASIRYASGRNSMGEAQKKGFTAGINALMVGNYLTTRGNEISDDLNMLKELGLEA